MACISSENSFVGPIWNSMEIFKSQLVKSHNFKIQYYLLQDFLTKLYDTL